MADDSEPVDWAIRRISNDSNGNAPDGHSKPIAFSPDSSTVLFSSQAPDLNVSDTAPQTTHRNLYLSDLHSNEITLLTRTDQDTAANAASDIGPSAKLDQTFSDSGDKILFTSQAPNLKGATGDDSVGRADVFVVDLIDGTVSRISNDPAGNAANGHSEAIALAPDGTKVLFQSTATNLNGVTGQDTNERQDAFIADLTTGEISRLTSDNSGNAVGGVPVAFSSDSTKVLFESSSPEIQNVSGSDTNDTVDVFLYDLITKTTTRLSSTDEGNAASDGSRAVAFSPDSTRVLINSNAKDLAGVTGEDTNDFWRAWDVYVTDINTGLAERISNNEEGNTGNHNSEGVAFSHDGQHVLLNSLASDLNGVTGFDPHGFAGGGLVSENTQDVFVADLKSGLITRISNNADGDSADDSSQAIAFFPDDNYVLFNSEASDLAGAPGEDVTSAVRSNGPEDDVFVANLEAGEISRLSSTEAGNAANNSGSLGVSPDGEKVLFQSKSPDLAGVSGTDDNDSFDAFVAWRSVRPSVFSINDITAREGDGETVFMVSLDEASEEAVTVTYGTVPGTANQDGAQTDYVDVVDETLEFAPGETEKPVSIDLIDDDVPESDETFELLLENPVNATLGDERAQATIIDDDEEPPEPVTWSISPENPSVDEDAGTIEFELQRSSAQTAQTVYVSTTQDQGSVNENDYGDPDTPGTYEGIENKAYEFAEGQAARTVSVAINDDDQPESDETFGLIAQEVPADPIDTNVASTTFTIEDNDDHDVPPTLGVVDDNILPAAAKLSAVAYSFAPGTPTQAFREKYPSLSDIDLLDDGWQPVEASDLGITEVPEEPWTFTDGVFTSLVDLPVAPGTQGAHLYKAQLTEVPTLALAFRGTDEGSLDEALRELLAQGFSGWDELYDVYRDFLGHVIDYAEDSGFEKLLITGHSLGGALTQTFMAEETPFLPTAGITFGSPGAEADTVVSPSVLLNVIHDDDGVPVQPRGDRFGTDMIVEHPLSSVPRLFNPPEHGVGHYLHTASEIATKLPLVGQANDLSNLFALSSPDQEAYTFTVAENVQSGQTLQFDALVPGWEGRKDILFGGPGDDRINGEGSAFERNDDILWGDGGDDILNGGGGDDLVFPGQGADFVDGGPGSDTVIISRAFSESRMEQNTSGSLFTSIGDSLPININDILDFDFSGNAPRSPGQAEWDIHDNTTGEVDSIKNVEAVSFTDGIFDTNTETFIPAGGEPALSVAQVVNDDSIVL